MEKSKSAQDVYVYLLVKSFLLCQLKPDIDYAEGIRE